MTMLVDAAATDGGAMANIPVARSAAVVSRAPARAQTWLECDDICALSGSSCTDRRGTCGWAAPPRTSSQGLSGNASRAGRTGRLWMGVALSPLVTGGG